MSKSVALQTLLSKIKDTKIVSAITDSAIHIGTHDGSFHCDEVFAISMLKCLPEYADATVVRTRNPEVLAQCNIVVDVGATYDPATHRYDHHQREFTGTMPDFNTKLSSAGLVYKHFGSAVLSSIVGHHVPIPDPTHHRLVNIMLDKVYKGFVEHIDAIDNGIAVSDGPLKYNVSTTLSSRVGHLLPAWNETSTKEHMNEQFREALRMVSAEFVGCVDNMASVWWPARSIVEQAVTARRSVHPSQRIMVLSQQCPWKDHIFDIEEVDSVNGISVPTLYVIFEDVAGSSWRVQCVPESPTSFTNRRSILPAFMGLRDETLSEGCKIPDCIFVHASGFIGGNKTKEGALQMAIKSLEGMDA
jgi:uncharacterized UPF0160 family protein